MLRSDAIRTTLSSDAAFLIEPCHRHVISESYVYGCLDEALFCFAMWGRPNEADATRLCRLLPCELEGTIPRHHSLVHFGAVESIDATAFDVLKRYVDRNAVRLAEQIAGQAVVFGGGRFAAMVIAGFHRVFPPPYPVRAFETVKEAVAWMLPHRIELERDVDAFLDLTPRAPPIVAHVRAVIDLALPAATLDKAARVIGCTARTLQRRLRAVGTTFQREHAHIQVERAKRLLDETDLKISVIGLEVGFTTASHFSQAFRRATGQTPQAWRRLSS